MSDDAEAIYFQAREAHARAMSCAAIDPGIRAIHAEMANRYADMAKGQPERPWAQWILKSDGARS